MTQLPTRLPSSPKPRWKSLLERSVTSADQLAQHFDIDPLLLSPAIRNFPMRITPYYLSLIRRPGDPIWRQVVPDPAELTDQSGTPDPLCEEAGSPVPGLIHRYPDRVVLLASTRCAAYCRFCMRKRKMGTASLQDRLPAWLDYIAKTSAIHEVILSGGDPLILDDEPLSRMLEKLRRVGHIGPIRIHSRMPCTLPQRITQELVRMLGSFSPVYLNIHFNHPDEITRLSADACAKIADAGIPLGSQTVLLKGVNDDAAVMHRLMERLLAIRVRPYYLHQLDQVQGTGHFHVPISTGLAIMDRLRGRLSGMGVPHYMVDLPGGGGKVPLMPEYVAERGKNLWTIRNYEGREFDYPLPSPADGSGPAIHKRVR